MLICRYFRTSANSGDFIKSPSHGRSHEFESRRVHSQEALVCRKNVKHSRRHRTIYDAFYCNPLSPQNGFYAGCREDGIFCRTKERGCGGKNLLRSQSTGSISLTFRRGLLRPVVVAESLHTEASQELFNNFRALTLGNSGTRRLQKEAGTLPPASVSHFLLLTLLVHVCRVWLDLTRARQPPRLLSLAKSGVYLGSSLSNPQPSCSIFRLPLGARRYLSK
jgi:hypothetical protein